MSVAVDAELSAHDAALRLDEAARDSRLYLHVLVSRTIDGETALKLQIICPPPIGL